MYIGLTCIRILYGEIIYVYEKTHVTVGKRSFNLRSLSYLISRMLYFDLDYILT